MTKRTSSSSSSHIHLLLRNLPSSTVSAVFTPSPHPVISSQDIFHHHPLAPSVVVLFILPAADIAAVCLCRSILWRYHIHPRFMAYVLSQISFVCFFSFLFFSPTFSCCLEVSSLFSLCLCPVVCLFNRKQGRSSVTVQCY